jgi:hypothetical protein
MKQKPSLKRSLSSLQSFSPCIVVKTKSIVTACLVDMVVFVLCLSEEFIIYADGFSGYRIGYLY